jgi:hypothetical protein
MNSLLTSPNIQGISKVLLVFSRYPESIFLFHFIKGRFKEIEAAFRGT